MMKDSEVVKIKGRSPKYKYLYTLSEVFNENANNPVGIEEFISELKKINIHMEKDQIIDVFFPYRKYLESNIVSQRPKFAGPFQMRELLDSLFQFNLRYQDTVVKLELEKFELNNKIKYKKGERNKIILRTFLLITLLLLIKFFSKEPLYLELTNMELDFLALKCVDLIHSELRTKAEQQNEINNVGSLANQISYDVLEASIPKIESNWFELIMRQIFSGVVWWSDHEKQKCFIKEKNDCVKNIELELENLCSKGLAINDFEYFKDEILLNNSEKTLIFFFDDNGEVVWDLYFIKKLLDQKPSLKIIATVNELSVANNTNKTNVLKLLDNPIFSDLRKNNRFELTGEKSFLPGIDLRFVSNNLLQKIKDADLAIVKGVSFFEKIQYINQPAYYMFVVYSNLSQKLTGLTKGEGIFARLGPHMPGFSHISQIDKDGFPGMTLINIWTASKSKKYKHLIKLFKSESKANLKILKYSQDHHLTFVKAIENYNLKI